MITAIIIEDEESNSKLLTSLLEEYCPEVRLLGCFDTVSEAQKAIATLRPSVVFMDIMLNGETAFDLLDTFDEIEFDIIFTTAFDSYMLKAIKISAIDYLLKPIDIKELKLAIEKVEKKRQQIDLNRNLQVFMHNFRNSSREQQIAIPSADGYEFVKISNIIYLKSDGSYTYFHLKQNGKIITSKNIKEYEDLLAEHNFFRIHKQYIINLNEVNSYVRGEGGYVRMSNDLTFDVSRRRKDEFLKMLNRV